jgi:hypothetical protein
MSDALVEFISHELDVLGTQLAAQRMSAGDTRLWAIATLTEAAYCLRAVRATGLLPVEDVRALLADATEVVFSDPSTPVQVVHSFGRDTEGKPN